MEIKSLRRVSILPSSSAILLKLRFRCSNSGRLLVGRRTEKSPSATALVASMTSRTGRSVRLPPRAVITVLSRMLKASMASTGSTGLRPAAKGSISPSRVRMPVAIPIIPIEASMMRKTKVVIIKRRPNRRLRSSGRI